MTPTDYAASIAAEVRAEMARQQKTVDDLAEVLGFTKPTADLRFKGERPYDLIEVGQIAVWLGKPVQEFLPAETEVPA